MKSDLFRLRLRWWGLVTAGGYVAGFASVLGFFGSLNWVFDICSHFRVQYALGLGLAALLMLIPRQRRSAAVFGALAAANLAVVLPLYFGQAPAPADAGWPVRALLVNVNREYGNPARVAEAVTQFKPDIVVLEEVSVKWLADLAPVLAKFKYSRRVVRDDNFGIALFSRFPFIQAQTPDIGYIVPSILAEIECSQGTCTVVATHPLPPAGGEYSRWRNAQLEELPQWIKRATSPVLLLGDLNVSPWSPHFTRLLRESGLRDSSQGRGVQPTWPAFNPLMLIPIDYCLYSPGIAILNRQTGPDVGSDHYPVIVDFAIGKPAAHQP